MQNLLVDCNYILMKAVFTLHRLNRLYSEELFILLDNNISKYTSMNKWKNVIIVSDSKKKSWRKQLLHQYKGTRVKNEEIDWDHVYEVYGQWKERISEQYTVLERDHIEGDDWIAMCVAYFNKQNESCFVISSDKDLYQLIQYKSGKKNYINVQVNDKLGSELIILPIGWQVWLDNYEKTTGNDIFELDDSCKKIAFFKRLTTNWQNEEVNQYQQLFEKIIQGDKSDNIDSIYQTATTTGKIRNIGAGGAHKIWNFYKNNYQEHFIINDEFKNDVIHCLECVNKLQLNDSKRKNVLKNLKNNIEIIYLNYKNYPEHILDEIMEVIQEKFSYT